MKKVIKHRLQVRGTLGSQRAKLYCVVCHTTGLVLEVMKVAFRPHLSRTPDDRIPSSPPKGTKRAAQLKDEGALGKKHLAGSRVPNIALRRR
jgi:hypothetical protein